MKTLQDIKKIAVLGAGTMGPGIAQIYAMGGYQVTMWTRSEATREKAMATLKKSLETFKEEDMLSEPVDVIYARVGFKMTVEEAVEGADYIQETIVENKDAKAALYEQLAACVDPEAIIVLSSDVDNFTIDTVTKRVGLEDVYAVRIKAVYAVDAKLTHCTA